MTVCIMIRELVIMQTYVIMIGELVIPGCVHCGIMIAMATRGQ